MSVEHLTAVLHHSQAKGRARLVLIGIANHQGDAGAWPSLATLSKYAGGITVRNVRKAIADLVELGELAVSVQGATHIPKSRRPNRYDVLVRCPEWCDGTPQHRDMRTRDEPMRFGVVAAPAVDQGDGMGQQLTIAGDPYAPP